ncbi:reverse transcriptase [Quillaja saponaria]|uniref:Reverse transcriptase n=1 Tax=Quillaja saponaria TaxID=32244 RepID=A0AAD7Q797_QUISA|nr:reverse transcriptase [Quillaja saponaria]
MEFESRGERGRQPKEEDLLQRSDKKVKIDDMEGGLRLEDSSVGENGKRKASYKESVLGGLESNLNLDTEGGAAEHEDEVEDVSDDDTDDGDFPDSNNCLDILLTHEEKTRLRSPWRKSLIVKLLGKRIDYNFLCKRLYQIWKPKGILKVIDLGNNFFLIRFSMKSDMELVTQGGP